MFVCPLPKISQVKMKRRRRASHLSRDTLWQNGRWATIQLSRFTLWHNGHRATTQLGRFTLCGTTAAELLHHSVDLLCGTTATELLHNSVGLFCGTTAAEPKQPGFIDACTRGRIHFSKTVTNHADNMKASSKVKFYSGCWTLWKIQQTTDKHRSISMLYEDKQQRWMPRTHESQCELAHQSEAKRKQSLQSEANVCRHKCNLEKTSLINCTGHSIMHRTPNTN